MKALPDYWHHLGVVQPSWDDLGLNYRNKYPLKVKATGCANIEEISAMAEELKDVRCPGKSAVQGETDAPSTMKVFWEDTKKWSTDETTLDGFHLRLCGISPRHTGSPTRT